jgi:hypothetical protein
MLAGHVVATVESGLASDGVPELEPVAAPELEATEAVAAPDVPLEEPLATPLPALDMPPSGRRFPKLTWPLQLASKRTSGA